MSLQVSTGLRNSQAGSLKTTYDSAILELYSGSQPPSADDAPTGTLIATLTLSSPAFSGPIDGVLSRGSTWEGTASASGDIGYGRFLLSGDGGGSSTTDIRFDVDVGTAINNIIRVNKTSINSGQKIRINNVSIEFPPVPLGFDGISNLVIPILTLVATGTVMIRGDVDVSFPALQLATEGIVEADGVTNLELPMLDLVASSTVDVQGEVDLTIPILDLLASTEDTAVGESSVNLTSLALTASGSVDVVGASNLILPQIQLNALSTTARAGIANLILPKLILASSGNIVDIGSDLIWPDLPTGTWEQDFINNFSGLHGQTSQWTQFGTIYNPPSQLSGVEDHLTDLNFPFGTSDFIRIHYAQGWPGNGVGPDNLSSTSNRFNHIEIIVRFIFRMSLNWQGHSSGVNKLGFIWSSGASAGPVLYFSPNGVGAVSLQPQWRAQPASNNENYPPNVVGEEGYTINRGEWVAVWSHIRGDSPATSEVGSFLNVKIWKESRPTFVHTHSYANIPFYDTGDEPRWGQWNFPRTIWGGSDLGLVSDEAMYVDFGYVDGFRKVSN